jgi:hypothetical protein
MLHTVTDAAVGVATAVEKDSNILHREVPGVTATWRRRQVVAVADS